MAKKTIEVTDLILRDAHQSLLATRMVLEAMKMETNITAPVSGKIKAINVAPGDAVTVDQVVVEFE